MRNEKDRCNKGCHNCFYEDVSADGMPCSNCEHRTNYKDNWKPKEPVVLSANEILSEFLKNDIPETLDAEERVQTTKTELFELFERLRKNYRLERDLELKAVVEAVKRIKPGYLDYHEMVSAAIESLKNIPPLEND